MRSETGDKRLAELQREAGRIAARGGGALTFGDWRRLQQLARSIAAELEHRAADAKRPLSESG